MATRCTSWAYVAAVLLLTGVSTATAKYSGGTGEPNDPYQIATAADLIALGEDPNDYDKHFILTADVDLDPNLPGRKVFDRAVIAPDIDPHQYDWFAGTSFTGVFDGKGHTISHLTITGEDYLGLFGLLGSRGEPGGEIRNLGVVDVNIVGSLVVGGLVGCHTGTVTNCYSTGAVEGGWCIGGLVGGNLGSITTSWSSGSVSGDSGVGGLVGENDMGTISGCSSSGAVNAYGTAGGLVGLNHGELLDFTDDLVDWIDGPPPVLRWVEEAVITTSWSSASVNGHTAGGLVGYNEMGTITGCYSSGAVKGTGGDGSNAGGLVGCSWDSTITMSYSSSAVVNGGCDFCFLSFSTAAGLVGYSWDSTITMSYSSGAVSGGDCAGGLVGYSWDSTITMSYSSGAVSGSDCAGGLVGGGDGSEVTACFWDIQASGQTESSGGTGKTTAEMQTAKTFLDAGWDFVGETVNGPNDVWKMAERLEYPRLWWEPYDGRVTVVLGEVFTVTLESNPSTGYRWEWVDRQDSIVEQMGEAQFKPRETGDPSLVGTGGQESFDFKAVHPGQMTLQLVYRRPWEEGVEPLKTFSLQVTVP